MSSGRGAGERQTASAVVDATGYRPSPALRLGYQKFLGQVLEFERPIDLAHPILMDASVAQEDGFRFVYVLPFTEHSALVEDTYYSESPTWQPMTCGPGSSPMRPPRDGGCAV